jgi:biotin carboxyl carrier protein
MKKFKYIINGNEYEVNIKDVEENIVDVEVNGTHYKVEVDKNIKPSKTPKLVRKTSVPTTDTPKAGAEKSTPVQTQGDGYKIMAPLPGVVLEVNVKPGDEVKVGQRLMVLEAMKMENNVDSDREGKVVSINVGKGDSVMQGDLLIVIG